MRLILLVNSLELDGLFVSNVQFNAFRSQVHLQISCDRDHQPGGVVAVLRDHLGCAGPFAFQRDRKVTRFVFGSLCRDHALGAVSEFQRFRPCPSGTLNRFSFSSFVAPEDGT